MSDDLNCERTYENDANNNNFGRDRDGCIVDGGLRGTASDDGVCTRLHGAAGKRVAADLRVQPGLLSVHRRRVTAAAGACLRAAGANGSGNRAALTSDATSPAAAAGHGLRHSRANHGCASACTSGSDSRCAGAEVRLGIRILGVESRRLGVGPRMLGGPAQNGRCLGRRLLGAAWPRVRLGGRTVEIVRRVESGKLRVESLNGHESCEICLRWVVG
jgi:hypothetical protein